MYGMICSNMDPGMGNVLKANINFLVSAGYGTFSSMPSSAKEPTEAIYTSSSSPKGAIFPGDEGLAGETTMKCPCESEPSETSSAKEPSEDFYSSSDPPKGTISPDGDSPAGDTPMEDPEESETSLKSKGARPKEKKSGPVFPLGNTRPNGKEQFEQGWHSFSLLWVYIMI